MAQFSSLISENQFILLLIISICHHHHHGDGGKTDLQYRCPIAYQIHHHDRPHLDKGAGGNPSSLRFSFISSTLRLSRSAPVIQSMNQKIRTITRNIKKMPKTIGYNSMAVIKMTARNATNP